MQSIKEKLEKSKGLHNTGLFIVLALALIGFVVFGAVKLVFLIKTEKTVVVIEASFDTNQSGKEGSYVASKSGGTYYFPWCGNARRIKDVNKVWFSDRISAEKAGYRPSLTCHGLQ